MATIGSNDKSQPQRLLEEVDSTIQHTESEQYPTDPPAIVNAPEFPTIQEQNAYWEKKEKAAEEPQRDPKAMAMAEKWEANKPRKWSLARRRAYNAKKAKGWVPVAPPPQEAKVPQVRFCPNCGCGLERFLA